MAVPKPIVFVVCLVPLAWMLLQAVQGGLGPDPGKAMVLATGIWAFRLLLATLVISPLVRLAGMAWLFRYRRMIGLFVWFYASLHFIAVWTYLLGWSWATFFEEFAERPYMAVGIVAWLLLIPLGVTSNRWAQRKLGRRWKRLHQLIYPIGVLVCIHFIWLVRSDFGEALIYSAMMLVLLLVRLSFVQRWVSQVST